MVISFLLPLFLSSAMVTKEHIPQLLSHIQEDIAQIQSGQLQEVTVWLSPKSHSARLPGPYSKDQPEPVTQYGGIGEDTHNTWIDFYIPDILGFSLDSQKLFDENENIQWN